MPLSIPYFKANLFILIFLPILVFSQQNSKQDAGQRQIPSQNQTRALTNDKKPNSKKTTSGQLEIPKLKAGEELVRHLAFTLVYEEQYEQAKWVAYQLTASETQKSHERTNKFIADPAIATGLASLADYKGSGYDRGHLAPASDMGWSETSMAESFLL